MGTDLIQRWKQLKRQLETLEAQITTEVLTLRTSITVGGVQVKYTRGRGSYDYQAMAHHLGADEALLAEHTKMVVDWKAVIEDMGTISEETKEKFYTPPEHPTVSIKLKERQAE